MRIDPSSGRIHWVIGAAAGEHLVRISAADTAGGRTVQEFSLNILPSR
jgi:hypothetical protein